MILNQIDNAMLGTDQVEAIYLGQDLVWQRFIPYNKQYLTVESITGGTFTINNSDIDYSINRGAWQTTTGSTTLTLNPEDKVRFRSIGKGNGAFKNNRSSAGQFKVYGNVESMEFGDNFESVTQTTTNNAFKDMFTSCWALTDASNLILPSVRVSGDYAYSRMFYDCTSLVNPPVMELRQIASESAATEMFRDCVSLTTAPNIKVTVLRAHSFDSMFQNCVKMTVGPQKLPATSVLSFCYYRMFAGCKRLTTAPELPAANIADGAYREMFSGCTALNYIKCLATSRTSSDSTMYWVEDVQTSSGTFVKDPSVRVGSGYFWSRGIGGVPENWTVIDAS